MSVAAGVAGALGGSVAASGRAVEPAAARAFAGGVWSDAPEPGGGRGVVDDALLKSGGVSGGEVATAEVAVPELVSPTGAGGGVIVSGVVGTGAVVSAAVDCAVGGVGAAGVTA